MEWVLSAQLATHFGDQSRRGTLARLVKSVTLKNIYTQFFPAASKCTTFLNAIIAADRLTANNESIHSARLIKPEFRTFCFVRLARSRRAHTSSDGKRYCLIVLTIVFPAFVAGTSPELIVLGEFFFRSKRVQLFSRLCIVNSRFSLARVSSLDILLFDLCAHFAHVQRIGVLHLDRRASMLRNSSRGTRKCRHRQVARATGLTKSKR